MPQSTRLVTALCCLVGIVHTIIAMEVCRQGRLMEQTRRRLVMKQLKFGLRNSLPLSIAYLNTTAIVLWSTGWGVCTTVLLAIYSILMLLAMAISGFISAFSSHLYIRRSYVQRVITVIIWNDGYEQRRWVHMILICIGLFEGCRGCCNWWLC